MSDSGVDLTAHGFRVLDHTSGETDDNGAPVLSPGQFGIFSSSTPVKDGVCLSGNAETMRELLAALVIWFGIPASVLSDAVLVPPLRRETAILDPQDAPSLAAALRHALGKAHRNPVVRYDPSSALPDDTETPAPRVLITGGPLDGFTYFAIPVGTDSLAVEAVTQQLAAIGEDYWEAELHPLTDLGLSAGDGR